MTLAVRANSLTLQWLPADQALGTHALLNHLSGGAGMGAIHQRKPDLHPGEHLAIPGGFNALIMQVREQGHVNIHWMLGHVAPLFHETTTWPTCSDTLKPRFTPPNILTCP